MLAHCENWFACNTCIKIYIFSLLALSAILKLLFYLMVISNCDPKAPKEQTRIIFVKFKLKEESFKSFMREFYFTLVIFISIQRLSRHNKTHLTLEYPFCVPHTLCAKYAECKYQ